MKVQTLASGSSGNCTFIDSGSSKILVDAGISARRISRSLESVGTRMDEIDAVVVSHEHSDHAKAITSLPVPVYVSSATTHLWEGRVDSLCHFRTGDSFCIGDMRLDTFPVPHNALDPVGFTVESKDGKVGIVTDIGFATNVVSDRLRGCDMLIIESNHDEGRLISGGYPWELKQRVGGRFGHLSNRQCSKLLESVVHGKLRFVVLAHLSERNNMPHLALESARKVTGEFPVSVHVAPKNNSGEVFVL